MEPSTHVTDRFVIERAAGSGGMGLVFRARDLHTGQPVAVKLLRSDGGASREEDRQRFLREARLLAELHHPHIVSYIAHGFTEDGRPYLAMEWLEGEDLGERLRRQGLTMSESLALVRIIAGALDVAHRRGIIHRDLKPGNLFLRDRQIERATVLDFGIARRTFDGDPRYSLRARTQTGMVIGTPEYMAPEQARGQRDLSASADIFSLGCVLFECLTGQPPFVAEHIVGVLAKILFEEPPSLSRLRSEVPPVVEALLLRMLAKDPLRRPCDGAELAAELAQLIALAPAGELATPAGPSMSASTTLSGAEQQLVSVVVASENAGIEDQATLAPQDLQLHKERLETLRVLLTQCGAQAQCLANESIVATLLSDERREATDQAASAARAALLLRERWPTAAIALCTGRGVLRGRLPIGEAIDRAARLLQTQVVPGGGEPGRMDIVIDDVTAGLLGRGFEVIPLKSGAHALMGEQTGVDATRLLLGKPTSCVGREPELITLEGSLATCIEDSVARAVLVIAPPGTGKSRLLHELLRRVRGRREEVEILIGSGDSMSAGSCYGLLRQALARLCGMLDGESPEEQRHKLRERVGKQISDSDVVRVTTFLAELCGVPVSETDLPRLRAARQDPQVMRDEVGLALVDFLRAECSAHPVLLVLEDLHWGDALSIKLVERVLREIKEQPLLVVALARPEVKDLFPNIWAGRVQEIPLSGLSRKASERLVLEVLGRDTPMQVVTQVVQRAAGNALFLEELLRAVAEGKGDELPDTVLAILQSRVGRIPPEVRRVLRAASMFGESFWRGGLLALLGSDRQGSDIDACLEGLIDAEILERHRESRFADEKEYGFRHALLRDAAYSLLTDEDRARGHSSVALYLESSGEREPAVLADHWDRGGDPGRALPFWVRAAQESYEHAANDETLRRVERGLSCGATGDALGMLRCLQTITWIWVSRLTLALPAGQEVLRLLPSGGIWWSRLLVNLCMGHLFAGQLAQAAEFAELFISVEPTSEARRPFAAALSMSLGLFCQAGMFAVARRMIQRIEHFADDTEEDATIRRTARFGLAAFYRHTHPNPWRQLHLIKESELGVLEMEPQLHLVVHVTLSVAYAELGDKAAAVASLQKGMAMARILQHIHLHSQAQLELATLWASQGDPMERAEAGRLAAAALEMPNLTNGQLGSAHAVQALVLLSQDQLAPAEEHARQAVARIELARIAPIRRLGAVSTLIFILLAAGRSDEARSVAEDALREMERLGSAGYAEVRLRLAVALAQRMSGEPDRANGMLEQAVRLVREQADSIPESAARTRFLTQVPENARVLELASIWFV